MQPDDGDGNGRQSEQRRIENECFPADREGFLVLPPVAQPDGYDDDGQRIPPRRREDQEMEQPCELREHEEELSEQRDFADAQQINRKRQHHGFGGERERQMLFRGVEPRRRQPVCEREHGEERWPGAKRLLASAGVQPVRPKGVERQQRAKSRAGPQTLRIKMFQARHAPAGGQ